ncbi:MAG: class I adenylate-forming enzyme family protein [Steroidobacteraceae bacterium]
MIDPLPSPFGEECARMALIDLFEAAARRDPAHKAVVDPRKALGYAALAGEARRLARALIARGLEPGDRVVMQVTNSCEAAVTAWAVLASGGVLVPLHAVLRGEALMPVLRDCTPRWAVLGAEQRGALAQLTVASPSLCGAFGWIGERESVAGGDDARLESWVLGGAAGAGSGPPAHAQPPLEPPRQDALAAILYTSGSTGEPKGVMLTHANMAAGVRAVNAYLRLDERDVIYSPLPLSSSYGLYQLLLGLAIGATVVLDRGFTFPAKSLELMARERATVFAAVPTMYAWLARSTILERHDLSSLRIMTSAAAALPLAHAQRVRERLPGARLYVMYGQTECKRISYLEPDEFDRRPGSVGRGMPFQDLAVVDEQGRRVGAGETGELVVTGPHVMQGYWGRPEETARKLRPIEGDQRRWLHTEDLFRIDADGYLYFVGRRDDVFKVGGHKVSPAEVEDVLVRIPGVVEAAVVGVPDAEWGRAVKAFLVPAEDGAPSVESVLRECARHLRPFMIPKAVEFLAQLPKTESGKIRKRDLLGHSAIN